MIIEKAIETAKQIARAVAEDKWDELPGLTETVRFDHTTSLRSVLWDGEYVYKIDEYDDLSQNRVEEYNANELREAIEEANLSGRYYVPETKYVDGIIVQEYVKGPSIWKYLTGFEFSRFSLDFIDELAAEELVAEATRPLRDRAIETSDLHGDNIIVMDDGRFAIIDCGFA